MPYVGIKPSVMERYLKGDSIYVGPTTPVNYRVMSTRVNPYTGNVEISGMREEQGQFPVLPGIFMSWVLVGLWNWLTGWFFSLFGGKKENNPLKLQFHYGYALKEDYSPVGYGGKGKSNGAGPYPPANGREGNWENDLAKDLYPLD